MGCDAGHSAEGREVTLVLHQIREGCPGAARRLLPLVYDELRRLASSRLAKLPPGQTLQATALVHEVYLRLVGHDDPGWDGRAHFFAAAARAMRNILVDQARRKASVKHGGLHGRPQPDDIDAVVEVELGLTTESLIALDDALERLSAVHGRASEVVMLRFFAGLTAAQCAEALGVTERTVMSDWRFARAWLFATMENVDGFAAQ